MVATVNQRGQRVFQVSNVVFIPEVIELQSQSGRYIDLLARVLHNSILCHEWSDVDIDGFSNFEIKQAFILAGFRDMEVALHQRIGIVGFVMHQIEAEVYKTE